MSVEQSALFGAGKRRQKYGARRMEVDGETFDSKAEARRWAELHLLFKVGEVSDLRRQVRYELVPAQRKPSGGVERACYYVADFVYRDHRGKVVIEDVKGLRTDLYVLKRKLMLLVHKVEVCEVKVRS